MFALSFDEEIQIVGAILKEKHKFQNLRHLYISSYDENTNFLNVSTFYFGYSIEICLHL